MILDFPGVTYHYYVSANDDPSNSPVIATPSTSNNRLVISDIAVTCLSPMLGVGNYITLEKGGLDWFRLPVDNSILPFSGWFTFGAGQTLGYHSVGAGSHSIYVQGTEV